VANVEELSQINIYWLIIILNKWADSDFLRFKPDQNQNWQTSRINLEFSKTINSSILSVQINCLIPSMNKNIAKISLDTEIPWKMESFVNFVDFVGNFKKSSSATLLAHHLRIFYQHFTHNCLCFVNFDLNIFFNGVYIQRIDNTCGHVCRVDVLP